MIIFKKTIYCSFILFLVFLCSCSKNKQDIVKEIFTEYKGRYVFIVNKKNFSMEIFNKDGDIIAKYKIGYGLNPDRKPKMHSGDQRTPEGRYRVTEILSMDAEKGSPAYDKLAAMNKVFFRASEGHYKIDNKKEDLGDNAYGPRFFLINYPNELDKKQYQKNIKNGKIKKVKGKYPGIGSGIAIHGNCDEKSIGQLSSSGCIRMYNSDIIELDRYIEIGTPVIILPE